MPYEPRGLPKSHAFPRAAFAYLRTMKYWEMIADKLARDGWTWGVVSYFDRDGRKMIVPMLTAATASGSLSTRRMRALRSRSWKRSAARSKRRRDRGAAGLVVRRRRLSQAARHHEHRLVRRRFFVRGACHGTDGYSNSYSIPPTLIAPRLSLGRSIFFTPSFELISRTT